MITRGLGENSRLITRGLGSFISVVYDFITAVRSFGRNSVIRGSAPFKSSTQKVKQWLN